LEENKFKERDFKNIYFLRPACFCQPATPLTKGVRGGFVFFTLNKGGLGRLIFLLRTYHSLLKPP
jgi:hypothetical protein